MRKTVIASAGNVTLQKKLKDSIQPNILQMLTNKLSQTPKLVSSQCGTTGTTLIYQFKSTPTDTICIQMERAIEACINALHKNNRSEVAVDAEDSKITIKFFVSLN
jgi:hypothetical protein